MATDAKPTPEERAEMRQIARHDRALKRGAEKVYAELPENIQRVIDEWAWDKAKGIVLDRKVPVDGPRFGPPYGVFWSLVALERDRLWHQRMLDEYGRQVYALVAHVDFQTEWLENDRPPQRTKSDVDAILSRLGNMPPGFESRPRTSTNEEWTDGRE